MTHGPTRHSLLYHRQEVCNARTRTTTIGNTASVIANMDDDDFDDLFAGIDDFPDSSQESLTAAAAANLAIPPSSQERDGRASHDQASQQDASMTDYLPKDHVLPGTPALLPTDSALRSVTDKIESMFETIRHTLSSKDSDLTIALKSKTTNVQHTGRPHLIRFPGKTADEAWRFSELHLLTSYPKSNLDSCGDAHPRIDI